MTLIIEDGSGKSDAESYVTPAELRTYARKRCASVPASDAECEALLVKANDYLQAQESRYRGCRRTMTQALAWPRIGVCVNGFGVAPDSIPNLLKQAQMQAAIEAQTVALLPTTTPDANRGAKKREVVGPLEDEWFAPRASIDTPVLRQVSSLLDPLMWGGAGMLKVIRA